MAEIKTGILGGVSGKVGSIVGAIWKGKNTIRTIPRTSNKKASVKQINQRSKFKLVSSFLQPLNFLLQRYFGAEQGLKSRANLALAYHLQEAVDQTDDQFTIKFEKVILSKGVLPTITLESAAIENETLALTWTTPEEMSLGKQTDLLTVVVYGKNTKLIANFHRVVVRSANSYSVKLHPELAADDCFLWYFVTDEKDEECSTSMFISTVTSDVE
ncbi:MULTISPECIES: DUF6266 family protein [unclassified Myroides]|uniref:DUF6266 family protein n=1 Tax=unclassified Myroides TaxID=2642485 RepID=UPI003D2F858E